jgi:drug/metabolite transporter (DMT)-like permease
MRMRVALAFSAIFIIWGSTYLAIRYAVAEIPPLLTAGVRHLTAGSVLYVWARAKGYRATPAEWKNSAIVGALFFLVGHGTLHWAEQSVPSGLSALLIATEPLWIGLLLAATGLVPLRTQTISGVLLGLAGVWALLGTDATRGGGAALGTLAVLVGAASWGAGVVYSRCAQLPQNPTLRTATTLLCGAVLLLATSTALGEYHRVHIPSALAIGSLAYLIVFGSIVSFTAYYWLLDRYPATLVATHTYVNPAVALLLGWAFAGEPLSTSMVGGLVLIAGAIALVGKGTPVRTATTSVEPANVALRRRRAAVSTRL